MTRQDLNGKLYTDVEKELGVELDAYIKHVNEIMDVEGLYALEQELMKEPVAKKLNGTLIVQQVFLIFTVKE